MICYKDKTFCGSKTHLPECDKQITQEEVEEAEKLELNIAYAGFCDYKELITNNN